VGPLHSSQEGWRRGWATRMAILRRKGASIMPYSAAEEVPDPDERTNVAMEVIGAPDDGKPGGSPASVRT